MKIGIFGCSWSHGTFGVDNHRNWPYYFAVNNPKYQIYNYAVAGSSIQFQIYLYEYVKKHKPADIYIFQCTRPERFTFFKNKTKFENLLGDIPSKDGLNNYKWFNPENIRKIITPVTIGSIKTVKQAYADGYAGKSIAFSRLYFELANLEIMELEWKMGIEYIKNKVDFCFLHTEGEFRNIKDLYCIEDILGIEYCKQNFYEAHDQHHFNKKGLQWQANWVKENARL